jgi:hypothetical protein
VMSSDTRAERYFFTMEVMATWCHPDRCQCRRRALSLR